MWEFGETCQCTDAAGNRENNWARAFYQLAGSKVLEKIIDKTRKVAERCDKLSCFLPIYSLSDGTGGPGWQHRRQGHRSSKGCLPRNNTSGSRNVASPLR